MKSNLVYGIMHAVEKGESLQQAMQGFVNAGYSVADVQEAARVVQGQQSAKVVQSPSVGSPKEKNTGRKPEVEKPILKKGQQVQKVSNYIEQRPKVMNVKPSLKRSPKVQSAGRKPIIKKPEKVSEYNQTNFKPQNSKKASKGLVIGLGIVLLILIAGLVSVLIFKESILSLFG